MPSSEILELILQELKQVQDRAEKLRAQEQNAVSDAATAKAISRSIEEAVQKIRNLIRDYEALERDKSA
jgi:hypothetical protein